MACQVLIQLFLTQLPKVNSSMAFAVAVRVYWSDSDHK
jgi:hypothetical protein